MQTKTEPNQQLALENGGPVEKTIQLETIIFRVELLVWGSGITNKFRYLGCPIKSYDQLLVCHWLIFYFNTCQYRPTEKNTSKHHEVYGAPSWAPWTIFELYVLKQALSIIPSKWTWLLFFLPFPKVLCSIFSRKHLKWWLFFGFICPFFGCGFKRVFARSHLREEIIQFDLQVALNLRKLNIRNFSEQMLNFYWIQVASKKPQETVRQLATNTCCITRHGRLQEGETSLTSQRFNVLGGWFPCFHVQRFIFFWWW